MEPRIVARPAFTVVGVLYRGKGEQGAVPRLWDNQLLPRAAEVQDRVTPPVSYGVIDHYDPQTGEYDYLAGFGVERVAGLPAGMVRWDVPAQTYAVFPCTLPMIAEGWDGAYRWLKESGAQHADGPDVEFYDEHFSGGNSTLYVCIPIKGS